MNIYAKKGHKVKVTNETKKNGHTYYQELVEKHLDIEKVYYVKETEVSNFSSRVELIEFPDVNFNSVNFVDA